MASTEKQVRMQLSLLVYLLISISAALGTKTLSVNPTVSTERVATSAGQRNPVDFIVPVRTDSTNNIENPSLLLNVEGSSVEGNVLKDQGLIRPKRQSGTFTLTQSDQDSVRILPANATSVFPLNDTHFMLTVHWAGEGSDVVVCLARNPPQSSDTSSSVFISNDYGRTFIKKDHLFVLPNNRPVSINRFFNHPKFNSHYVFTDTTNKYIFTTTDYGATVQSYPLEFTPDEIIFDEREPLSLLVYDKTDRLRRLWFSRNFGMDWSKVKEFVKSYFLDTSTSPTTLYVEYETPGTDNIVLSSSSMFTDVKDSKVVITNVEDFELRDDFMLATRRTSEGDLDLLVSFKRGPFVTAQFPSRMRRRDFHIADISEGQLMVCVNHDSMLTNLYISNVPDATIGVRFSLSLERVLYFYPEGTFQDSWLREASTESFVDIHKLGGVRGIYMASQLRENATTKRITPEDLITVISFDKGGEWKLIQPPRRDDEGQLIDCQREKGCSLHLGQRLSQLYPINRTAPILTSSSAPGVVVATGVVGASLKGHPGLYVSSDAGLTWHQALKGLYWYAMGDHGGVIVAVKMFKADSHTNELLYSTDEGATWHTHQFIDEPIRVYGLITEPGENTTVFTMFGSRPGSHQWVIVTVDLKAAFQYECKDADYKLWSPSDSQTGRPCLLGHQIRYQRRLVHANCYNGRAFVRPTSVENCECRREDFECDFGFKEEERTNQCIRDPDMTLDPFIIPSTCSAGQFYNRTKGYRLVAGDTCTGGDESRYSPELISCPVSEEADFILVAQRQKILRIDLRNPSHSDPLPLPSLQNVFAIEFDLKNNCVYWADSLQDKIWRLCMDGKSTPQLLVESQLESIEGMTLDWLSNNLYFVDGARSKIEVIRTDVSHAGRMRRTILNGTVLDKPRGITVHPTRGYVFYTDWSSEKPCVCRAHLDGTSQEKLIGAPMVQWPNGVTIDFFAERLYWVDAKNDYIASADLDGKNVKKIIEGTGQTLHPFAVAIFKGAMYWDDWNAQGIFMADKNRGTGLSTLATQLPGVMDLKVFSQSLRHGSNACSNTTSDSCQFLCTGRPNQGRTCLCPDGMNVERQADGNEKCLCPDGIAPQPNGTCHTVNHTCPTDFFQCSNELCIPDLWKCDGDNDCVDKSDELNCGVPTCSSTQFRCANGRCLPPHWKCDFDNDCGDGSDEEGCVYSNCTSDQFSCKNGRCISARWRCDFEDDCRDGSDEANCTTAVTTCRPGEFSCAGGAHYCVPLSWKCDGEKDCSDGSDESQCDSNSCETWHFQCSDKRCILKQWVCDGDADCLDGSDEVNCSSSATTKGPTTPRIPFFPVGNCSQSMFECANHNCVPFWWKCDGQDDCGDGSDEVACAGRGGSSSETFPTPTVPTDVHTCGEHHFQCNNGDCVWESWVCDGEADCAQSEDEENCHTPPGGGQGSGCAEFLCMRSGGCVPYSAVCNGHQDCADNSDEEGCGLINPSGNSSTVTCPRGTFRCDGSVCLPLRLYCNNHTDCYDGTDESNCRAGGSRIYQVSRIFVDDKNSDSSSLLIEWEVPVPAGTNVSLEFLPSYSPLSQNGSWTNVSSWTSSNEMRLTNLTPSTQYNITVYVRAKESETVYPPALYATTYTKQGAPSPPWNVTVRQLSHADVQINWNAPVISNGIIVQYQVFVSPPTPPFSVVTRTTELMLSHRFVPGVNYTFYVKAETTFDTSEASSSVFLIFDGAAVIDRVSNLRVDSVDNVTARLVWDAPNNVTGYWLAIKSNNFYASYPTMNTTNTSITVTGLSPATRYTFEVSALRQKFSGPPASIVTTTTGDELPGVYGLQTTVAKVDTAAVKLEWQPPKDKRKLKWEYGIYYGANLKEMYQNGVRFRTTETAFTVKQLDACESYIFDVAVVGPVGFGPGSDRMKSVTTEFDRRSPPKNVNVRFAPHSSVEALITWAPPCPVLSSSLGYKISVRDVTMQKTSHFTLAATKNATLEQPLTVHYGADYEITIQTDQPGARPFGPLPLAGPPIPPPHQLSVGREANGSLVLYWREQDLPPEVVTHNYSYIVWISHEREYKGNTTHRYPSTEKQFRLPANHSGQLYYASVSILDSHGYQSPRSEPLDMLFMFADEIKPSSSTESSHVYVAVAVAVVVVLALAASLVILLVRHRRLQRSFVNFVNPHYDTRSGAATFTDQTLEEEDSPVIRGFSDDEPLVIA